MSEFEWSSHQGGGVTHESRLLSVRFLCVRLLNTFWQQAFWHRAAASVRCYSPPSDAKVERISSSARRRSHSQWPRCQPALPGSACSQNGTLRQGLEVRHARVRQEQEDEQQRGETAKRLGQRDQKGSTEEAGGEEEGPVQRRHLSRQIVKEGLRSLSLSLARNCSGSRDTHRRHTHIRHGHTADHKKKV